MGDKKGILTFEEILKVTHGHVLSDFDLDDLQTSEVLGVSTDSRSIQKGELFIPLVGENFDGHNFIGQAVQNGASVFLTMKASGSEQDFSDDKTQKVIGIQVKDTLTALQDLASYYRNKYPFKIIGITGSNGKTTTKVFTQTILSSKYRSFASEKSFNNHIGVPLTLLSLKPDTEYGIVEIGMNHKDEIAHLTQMAKPDIALVTTVGRAHLMDFGGVEGISKEKSDLYKYSKENAQRIFNLDNLETKKMYESYALNNKTTSGKESVNKRGASFITFSSRDSSATVYLKAEAMDLHHLNIRGRIGGVEGQAKIPVFGEQNLINLMGASAIALASNMTGDEIWKALPLCQTSWGRNMLITLQSGAKVIFDGYNANPDSMKALIENLSKIKVAGKKIIILGDMLEMGDQASQLHRELGEMVGKLSLDIVCFVGGFSKDFGLGIKSSGFQNKLVVSDSYKETLAGEVSNMIEPEDIVVIKGSRGARLERFLPHLKPL